MTIIPNLFAFFIGVITLFLACLFLIFLLVFFIRRKRFPKVLMIATLSGATLYLAIVAGTNLFYTFDTIDRNHTQPGPPAITSPDGRYEAEATYELYGGVLGGVNVWVDVVNTETRVTKTIYYADAVDQVKLEWLDEQTLSIQNKSMGEHGRDYNADLHVETEIFHDQGRACWSLLMKKEYERCYSETSK